MKNPAIKIILLIISSLILLYLGMMFYGNVLELMLPIVGDTKYQVNTVQGLFYQVLIFSFVLALIPWLLFITWKVANIKVLKQKLISVAIVTACVLLAIIVRRQLIKSELKDLNSISNIWGEKYGVSFPIANLHFEYYMLGGIVAGCLVIYFIFKNKKTPL